MNKNILAKLMELDNKKADAYLNRFANKIKGKISESKNNDEIFKNLELLEEFVYKVPTQTIDIVNNIVKNRKPNQPVKYKSKIVGEREGKNHIDLIIKCAELLDKIRYIKLKEVFNLLVELCGHQNQSVVSVARKGLEDLAKYDFDVLKHFGYSIQRTILDIILGWPPEKKILNIEIIKVVAEELLKSSFEGTSMRDYKTMVFHSGALGPTDPLKKIRKDTIDLLLDLYKQTEDLKERVSLLQILVESSYFPSHGEYGKKMEIMIANDIKTLINAYRKIIFKDKGKIIAEAPIVQEIEEQLIWFNKNHKDEIPKITKLLNKISKDEFYDLYKTLIGNVLIEEGSWEEAEEKRKRKVDAYFQKINIRNVKTWSNELNLVAKYKDVVDIWKFQFFENFIFRIAKEKPDLAGVILDDTFKKNKPLKNFVGVFLRGFRAANSIKKWRKYVQKIVKDKEKDVKLLISIPASLLGIDLKYIRQEDIKLLSQIISKEKPYDFIKKIKKSELLNFYFSLIQVLVDIYRKDKKRIESLIMTLLKGETNEQYIEMYIEKLSYAAYKKEVDLAGWSKQNIKIILDRLVELKKMDYDTQILLLAVAQDYFSLAMEVFIKRIRERTKQKKEKGFAFVKYDGIPYDLNNEFKEYIAKHKEYPKIAANWINKMSLRFSIYNWELAHLVQRIDGPIFDEILLKMIKEGGNNLKKAILLLQNIKITDYKICFKIIKKTHDKKDWQNVKSLIYNTGVVSGEYGIAEAYEKKAEEIKKYPVKGTKKEKERAEEFKKEIIKDLLESAKRERQRANEEIKLRKLEYGDGE